MEEDISYSGVVRRNNNNNIGNENGSGLDTKIFDWKFLEEFSESINQLFMAEAISNVGDKHSYIVLSDMKQRKNPDVARVVNDLLSVIQFVNFKPLFKPN